MEGDVLNTEKDLRKEFLKRNDVRLGKLFRETYKALVAKGEHAPFAGFMADLTVKKEINQGFEEIKRIRAFADPHSRIMNEAV